MKTAAFVPRTRTTRRTEGLRELMDDLLDEAERTLEEDDVEWCAVVRLLLLVPAVEREVSSGGASLEAPSEATRPEPPLDAATPAHGCPTGFVGVAGLPRRVGR